MSELTNGPAGETGGPSSGPISNLEVTPVEFLRGVFGEEWPGWLVLWRSDTRRSAWLAWDELDSANEFVARCRNESRAHAYYSVGLQRGIGGGERGTEAARGTAAGVTAIPGVWLDLDTAEGAVGKNSRKNYPPLATALAAIDEMPVRPSVIVNSGGGLHVYWLFNSLFEIGNNEDRECASSLTTGWERIMAARLHAAGGYEIDRVSDLARVLRPVGSWNWSHARAVELLAPYRDVSSWVRYGVEDLEPFIPTLSDIDADRAASEQYTLVFGEGVELADTPDGVIAGGTIVASHDASPPQGKLAALLANSPEFAEVWRGGRQFPSSSERELSLAHYAAEAMWNDQEIANLIVASRRSLEPSKMGKVLRVSYLRRTIGIARGDTARALALQAMQVPVGLPTHDFAESLSDAREASEASAAASEGDYPTPSPGGEVTPTSQVSISRRQHLDALSIVFGIRVEGWIQMGLEDPIYILVHSGGKKITIGSSKEVVMGDLAFRNAVYANTGVCFPPIKKGMWPGICTTLAAIRELHLAESSENKAALREQVERYLSQSDYQPKGLAMLRLAPFIEDGFVCLSMPTLLRWINQFSGEKWHRRWLYATMTELGWHEDLKQTRIDGRKVAKRYWSARVSEWRVCLPPSVVPTGVDDDGDDDGDE